MLVLSRKSQENVVLDIQLKDGTTKRVLLRVIDIRNRKVKLGFDTDKDVTILREELLSRNKEEPELASVGM